MGLIGKIFKKDEKEEKKTVELKSTDKVEVVVKDENKAVEKEIVKKTPEKKKVEEKKEETKVVVPTKKVSKRQDSNAYKMIEHPLITEKATDLANMNKYVFVVPVTANKPEVAKAITNIYGVKPTKINIIKKEGKKVRYGRKFGKRKGYKKAIATFAEGDKIEVDEGV